MKLHSLLLTLVLAFATSYGLAQTGQTGSQAGQYPSSQSPTTQQEPSTQQMPPSTSPDQGQTTGPDQTQASPSSAATAPDNDALAQQVQQKLSTEPALKNVQVEAKKGVVTLSGTVASKADRKHAEELAKSVPGVKKVHAKLKVNPNAAATTSGAAETPAPSAAGNTEGQAGTQPGNQEPGSMSNSGQTQNQEGAENRSAEQGQAGMNPRAQPQSPGTAQTQPGQMQPGMSQQGVETPNAGGNNQMGSAANSTQLQSEIQNALSQQGSLSGSNIQANVTDTTVELTGKVATPDQKQTAERIAGSYAGNRRVENHITVGSLSGQTGGETPNTPSATQPQTMPGQGSVNPQTPPRQTPPSQQQQPPMSETPPQPQL